MLRTPASHIILDNIVTTPEAEATIKVEEGIVNIIGYTPFNAEDVVDCFVQCPQLCKPAVLNVKVIIPESCECPYEWSIRINAKQCTDKYEVQSTFETPQIYTYVSNDGSVPTAQAVRNAIVAQINAHQFAKFTAAAAVAVDEFTITEKNCDGLLGSCGIEAFVSAGTVTVSTQFVAPVMPAWRLKQLFPIKWGAVGSDPKLARCAEYCVLYLHIRGKSDIQDIDMNRTYSDFDREVYFYFDSDSLTDIQTVLGGVIPCIEQ